MSTIRRPNSENSSDDCQANLSVFIFSATSSCLLRQPDQIVHALDESMHRHVTDATMQMESELPVQSLEADIQSVVFATLLQ